MKYIYLINEFNFKNKTQEIVNHLKPVSDDLNRDYEIVINKSIEDIQENMKRFKDSQYIIIATGGDGSINLVLNDIVDTKNILSYIPIGTGNDFYRANLEDLDDGIHDVDIVRINDKYFINVACFGIDADIANDDRFIHNKLIPEALRYDVGVVYYFLTYKGKYLNIDINDQHIYKDITTIVVANAKYYGGGYKVAPYSSIQDGQLEVYVVDKLNKIKMANVILSMKDAKHLNNPALQAFKTNKLSIYSDSIISGNIDGEKITSKRFDIEIIPKGFKLEFDSQFIKRIREIKYKD